MQNYGWRSKIKTFNILHNKKFISNSTGIRNSKMKSVVGTQ